MHANHREEVQIVSAGDIAAGVGLKTTFTGDTLSAPESPIVLESIKFPEPVISVAIEPKTKADEEKMSLALARLAEEDPTFRTRTDPETGQTLISGMGELHLEVIVDRMLREFRVAANIGRPQVAYREAVTKPAEAEGRYVRQTGGKGQFGDVTIEIEPLQRGTGFEYEWGIRGERLSKEWSKAIQAGIKEAMENGVISGYPVVDLKARVITALVPLATMFGYVTDLRSRTQGRGSYSMEPDHYEVLPQNLVDQVTSKK